MYKPIVYIDMDCVLADFYGHPGLKIWNKGDRNPPAMYKKGFFLDLKPLDGAIDAVNLIIDSGKYDVRILSKPIAHIPYSYSEKVMWIMKYLPRLTNKITLTQDKSQVLGDYLVDDEEQWKSFKGTFLHFGDDCSPSFMWNIIIDDLGV